MTEVMIVVDDDPVEPGKLWIGYHNVPKGWNFPRAHHLRVSVSAFMESAGQ